MQHLGLLLGPLLSKIVENPCTVVLVFFDEQTHLILLIRKPNDHLLLFVSTVFTGQSDITYISNAVNILREGRVMWSDSHVPLLLWGDFSKR